MKRFFLLLLLTCGRDKTADILLLRIKAAGFRASPTWLRLSGLRSMYIAVTCTFLLALFRSHASTGAGRCNDLCAAPLKRTSIDTDEFGKGLYRLIIDEKIGTEWFLQGSGLKTTLAFVAVYKEGRPGKNQEPHRGESSGLPARLSAMDFRTPHCYDPVRMYWTGTVSRSIRHFMAGTSLIELNLRKKLGRIAAFAGIEFRITPQKGLAGAFKRFFMRKG